MLELLETLEPKFDTAFKKKVKMTEVTIFSLQLTNKDAVVMTNRNFYLMRKGLFGVKTIQINKTEIKELKVEGDNFYIVTKDEEIVIKKIEARKASLLSTAIKKF